MSNQNKRQASDLIKVGPAITVRATSIGHGSGTQVVIDLHSGTAVSSLYMTAADARAVAAGLIAASDHYDRETARLAALSNQEVAS